MHSKAEEMGVNPVDPKFSSLHLEMLQVLKYLIWFKSRLQRFFTITAIMNKNEGDSIIAFDNGWENFLELVLKL